MSRSTQLMRKRLDYIWRLFGTGLSFVIFGLGGIFISILVFPLIFVFVRSPDTSQRIARRIIGNAFGAFIWMMKGLGVLSYEIKGVENAGDGHNQLIIANHPTLIDVIFLVSLFPMVDCVVKEGVRKNPFMRRVVVPAKYISSNDPAQLLDSCVKRLKSGGSLLLFPEGTRSVHGQPLDFKLGAASVAIRSSAEVLPVMIQCSQPGLLAKHVPWYRIPPEKPFFTIQIQQPVGLQESIVGDLNPRQATRALNEALLRLFEVKTA